MLRRTSTSESSSSARGKPQLAKIQVSPPYFWDFGVYERVFGKNNEAESSTANTSGEATTMSTRSASSAAASSTSSSSDPQLSAKKLSGKTSDGEQGDARTDFQSKRPALVTSFHADDLITYVVQFGDTFESIALKHNMTAVELRRANPGVPFFSRAVPGQELKVKKPSEVLANQQVDKDATEDKGKQNDDNEEATTIEGVEHEALLCLGSVERLPGRLIVGITSGFVLFEPFESFSVPSQVSQNNSSSSSEKNPPVKMIFALDRRDILGCAAVSRINARIRPDDQDPSMLLQVVWKNAELGFPDEQQIFFEVNSLHISELVDAIYASDPIRKATPRSSAKSLTSGVAALRLLLENQSSALVVEDFIASGRKGSVSIQEDVVLDVTMTPRDSLLVSKENITTIATMLPERLHNSRWQLLYDFTTSGVSLDAFFSTAKSHRETVLLVRDIETKEVIGTFTVEPWDYTQYSGFFGSGETFVFKIDIDEIRDIQKFSWSGTNEFFQTCSPSHLAVGGGGHFAICLDNDLLHCTSGPCKTFAGLEDKSLSSKPSFSIDGIELWGFEPFKTRSPTLSFEDWSRSPALTGQKVPRSPRGSDVSVSSWNKDDEASKSDKPLKTINEMETDGFVKL